jgi:hypothetical protein
MIDDTLVINPGGAPATPAEQAVLGYLELRKLFPLSDRWTQRFEMVPADSVRVDTDPSPQVASEDGQEHLIACYLEAPDYRVELLFLSYLTESDIPGEQTPTGGFRLEFHRKDGASPTTLECNIIAHMIGGRPFGVIGPLERGYLDGDPEDRPWPTTAGNTADGESRRCQTRVFHFCMVDEPRPLGFEHLRAVRSLTVPTVWKCNTLTMLRRELRLPLRRRLRKLRGVHEWLLARSILGYQTDDVDQYNRAEALRTVADLEQRYGTERLEAIAGLPPAESCPEEECADRITHAIARIWGQLLATRWLLRRVNSDQS